MQGLLRDSVQRERNFGIKLRWNFSLNEFHLQLPILCSVPAQLAQGSWKAKVFKMRWVKTMNGIEASHQIRSFLPDVSVLYMTGYAEEAHSM